MLAEEVGNKRFIAFVQDRFVEGKKSFFEPICKVRLKTGSEKKKKVLKSLSVLKEDCQAFGLLVNKTEKLAEAFKYPITSVPLAVATPESTLYQSDKAGLRNYMINLSKRSSHKYPRDAQWVIDGMAAIRLVPPRSTYEEWFKTLVKPITPPAEARATSLKIIMDTYVELSVKEGTRRQPGDEPGLRTFISGLQQKMPQGDKWLSLLSNGENKTDLIHLFVNSSKYMKKMFL